MSLPVYSCTMVQPEEVERSTSWDIHPFLESDEPVLQSREQIEQIGILHPPLAVRTGENGYELVSGFRTCKVWSKINGDSPLLCRIFRPATSPSTILRVLYYEYSSHKPLGAVETAHFIRLAREKLAGEEEVASLLALLGLQPHPSFRNRALQLLQLEQQIQRAIWAERINESAARELLQISAHDRLTLFALAQELELGSSKLRRLLYLMRDLAGREEISFTTLAEDTELREIMDHPEMNIPQKGQAILKVLQHRQNATLYQAEKSFAQWRSGLNLPDSWAIEHSKSFESDETTLSITFSDREKLERALPGITALLKQDYGG